MKSMPAPLLIVLLALGGILVAVLVAVRFLLPPVLSLVCRTRSRELFLLTIIVLCLGIAWLTSLGGLSLAIEGRTGRPPEALILQHAEPGRADVEPLTSALLGELLAEAGLPDKVPFELSAELVFPGGVSAALYCSFRTENQQLRAQLTSANSELDTMRARVRVSAGTSTVCAASSTPLPRRDRP